MQPGGQILSQLETGVPFTFPYSHDTKFQANPEAIMYTPGWSLAHNLQVLFQVVTCCIPTI